MSPESRKEYLKSIQQRYHESLKKEKNLILNEFCQMCGYHRKYAIRLLNKKIAPKEVKKPSKKGRKKQYTHPLLLSVLFELWSLTNLPCSKRLKAIIPLWLPHYPIILPNEIHQALLRISPATIDRLIGGRASQAWQTWIDNNQTRFITQKANPHQNQPVG